MPRWLQTLFGLREDQLIRNGRLSFWVSIVGIVLFITAAVAVYWMMNVRLSAGIDQHLSHLRQDVQILSSELAEETQLLTSCRIVANLLERSMVALSTVWIIIVSLVVFCVYAALVSLRMREMAREIQMLKGKPGAAGDGVYDKPTQP
ncbi:MAG: hypothetical protein V4662_11435 [Verrucomicrobiota bacterium]